MIAWQPVGKTSAGGDWVHYTPPKSREVAGRAPSRGSCLFQAVRDW
jgi:hypothetical protein